MHQPLQLDSFDELIHVGTLVQLLDTHTLFPRNTILPVSPYYPGLELATAATRWLTGLPLVVDELVVLAAVRVVLVLVVFLVVERACHSSRAGGIGVLVYAASPQFYGFDAQYAYETIALAFAVAVVYLLFVSIDADRPKMGRSFALALGCVVAVVFSHHVTGWFTVGFLVVGSAALYLTSHPLRRPALTSTHGHFAAPSARLAAEPPSESEDGATVPSLLASDSEFIRRRTQAGIVGISAAVGLLVGGVWTVYVSHLLAPYLGPAFSAAATEISQALGSGHGNRALFQSAAGGGSPDWAIALILAAAIGWCVLLVPSLYSVIFRRSVRGGALRYFPAAIAAIFPISLLADISTASKAVADRAATFIFFGVALVVAAWLARRISRYRPMIERVATIGVATVIFVGSLILGFGPVVSLLPGPYVVGGDNLSYGSPSLAMAHWVDTHLPAGSHVAADHDNTVLLSAIGGVTPVRSGDGEINPETLYFDHSLTPFDIHVIRKDNISYIVVDDRLAQGRPLYGTYIAEGEPTKRLTLAELDKFNSYPQIKRVYDNGSIQVYDTTELLAQPPAAPPPAGAPAGGTGFDVYISVLAALVAVSWLLRLRRRWATVRGDAEHLVVCGVVGALVVGILGAFLIRLTHVAPEIVAVVVLDGLFVLSLRPERNTQRGWLGLRRTSGPTVPLEPHTEVRDLPEIMVCGAEFHNRREIKDVLAYLRLLANPDDEDSARRIVNSPERDIDHGSVSRLSAWAEENNFSFGVAIDHAADAGLAGNALLGAQQLSKTLSQLRPLVHTANPADFVQLVVVRTGYQGDLVGEHTRDADDRLENLADLATEAGSFDDIESFLETVGSAAGSAGLVSTATIGSRSTAGRPDPVPPTIPATSRSRRSRSQVVLGCCGFVLFAVGATVATVAALPDLTPPAELSISTSATGDSVADVQLGSAGPVAALLEVRNGGTRIWRSGLARTSAAQSVDLPARVLHKGSRVLLISGGHTLRRVDG